MRKNIFISYSWDSDVHKQWVLDLAHRLEIIEELHVVLDQYDLDRFSDKDKFMEQGVFDSEVVLIVSTEDYVEKANARMGGVGIETKLASSRHWEESAKIGSSNILVLRRSGVSTPNYLKEKLHIDFSLDEKFETSLKEILKHLDGTSKVARPAKALSLKSGISIKEFTRSEDILKINHKKRRLLFDRQSCTDFSSGKRIKFELWETQSPRRDHYLILFKNTTIKDTIERFCDLYKKSSLKIKELTILRPTTGDISYMYQLFEDNSVSTSLTGVTYSDFIWEYCIDEEAKTNHLAFENPFFIDQSLISLYKNEVHDLGPASEFVIEEFGSEQKSAALIVLAPGGMGKTTLCQNLANHYQNEPKTAAIFIQSETIKNSSLLGLAENTAIDSIYDLYETYAKIISSESPESFTYDRTTFELSLLSGNLVVIVDGIDELLSIFTENFNLEAFFDSIIEINNQLGNSKIILTSRNDIFAGESLKEKEEIKKLNLLGFDEITCHKYLKKRFKKHPDLNVYCDSVMSHVKQILTSEENDHVLPFFVDLISELVEENEGKEINFDLSLQDKNYESNSEIIDCLVYSVFRREFRRHDLEISIENVAGIFQEIASIHGETFPAKAIDEHILIFYNEFHTSLTRKILLNPLLLIENGQCKFKYDFLADYFCSLYLIDLINSCASDDQFVSVLARHAYGDKAALKDVKKYYCTHPDKFFESCSKLIPKFITKIDENAALSGNDAIYRALSAITHIALELPQAKGSKESATDVIKKIFNSTGKLEYFSVYGDMPSFDFTNTAIWHSRFVKHKKFLSSKFKESKFFYSVFEGINSPAISSSFDPKMFESCRLGDLDFVIDQVNEKQKKNNALIEKEVSKFLSSFFNRGAFVDKKLMYIKLSDKAKTVGKSFFDRLLKEDVLLVKIKKSDEVYYEINSKYHQSVHNFLNNNIINSKIRKIINYALQ
jgi:hypothetical protein